MFGQWRLPSDGLLHCVLEWRKGKKWGQPRPVPHALITEQRVIEMRYSERTGASSAAVFSLKSSAIPATLPKMPVAS